MFALLFLLLGVLFLLAAVGRMWIDATPVDVPTSDSTAAHNGEADILDRLSGGNG
ncbi:MAG: hypothetical protein LZF60_190022 [Nitrospira sp.]|nr:MAG: hypothetical protein LZF60_190022 [Nitrospira sp.]